MRLALKQHEIVMGEIIWSKNITYAPLKSKITFVVLLFL